MNPSKMFKYSTTTCGRVVYYQANHGELAIIEEGSSLVIAKGAGIETPKETAWSDISQETFEAKLQEAIESFYVTASRLATRNAHINDTHKAPKANGLE